jgi:copper chaperone NosL
MKALRRSLLAGAIAAGLGCVAREPEPAPLDTEVETCRFCRMPVSDPRLAAQLAAPGEEPVFFDDIGCLRDFLRERPVEPGSVAYVADHRSPAWIRADAAVYSRCPSLETPMGSHLIAHASAASRDEDPAMRGCAGVSPQAVLGSSPLSGRQEGD